MKHELQELEEILLIPKVRADGDALGALLANDFFEIGKSGRRWSRDEILEALPEESPIGEARITSFEVMALGEGTSLVSYDLELGGSITRRSSIWQKIDNSWRIRFHQGTIADEST
ncbi:MAG: nuclear transport factor 2 family protein [Pseudomonadales bacterium]|nr:nuclear transport factor 2 family protein [Pseudomonadales bacterium]MBO6564389.1 nuclear transport factor 2 family protein [Pseudomonadales bacterium]